MGRQARSCGQRLRSPCARSPTPTSTCSSRTSRTPRPSAWRRSPPRTRRTARPSTSTGARSRADEDVTVQDGPRRRRRRGSRRELRRRRARQARGHLLDRPRVLGPRRRDGGAARLPRRRHRAPDLRSRGGGQRRPRCASSRSAASSSSARTRASRTRAAWRSWSRSSNWRRTMGPRPPRRRRLIGRRPLLGSRRRRGCCVRQQALGLLARESVQVALGVAGAEQARDQRERQGDSLRLTGTESARGAPGRRPCRQLARSRAR